MSDELQCLNLQNGVKIPSVAFGCAFGDWVGKSDFQGFLPEQAWYAVNAALDAGYTALDGAHVYGTERIVGSILGQRLASGALQREELFITTKLAHPAAPPHINLSHLRTWDADKVDSIEERLKDDFARTLDDLAFGYVDLLLIHWPGTFAGTDASFAREARARIWKTFIELYKKGATRAIGVSNFTKEHLTSLMEDVSEIKPMVNQVEYHPYCQDRSLQEFCQEHHIVLAAYAPFASGAFSMLKDPVLVKIAENHRVSVGQVILRWHVQSGRCVLPKSSNPKRMKQNLALFDFSLSDEEIAQIDALGSGDPQRTCPDPSSIV
ncbi:aldo/keto reductase family protein [Candidatus Uabimicrobium amorphum]|uniref:Glyoxal reductase n=1 Tax=Uabimicrobium amorphum TaxID=2596890 RepID=A0A5S9ISE1_UABAM|nr:aldo/keto reductase [Candidatus Uabimicrobium amorphum]BBM87239.1 glyoxal reductase [Candidatus Uabimicrobium amorphum]